MPEDSNQDQLFRARVTSVDAVIAAAVAVERLALKRGLVALEASHFRFVIEELGAERLAHAFAPDEQAQAQIVLELRPGEFVVVIQDAGIPIDAAHTAAGAKGWLAQLVG